MVTFPRVEDPKFPPRVDPLTREFELDQADLNARDKAAGEDSPGRFAEPRIRQPVEDVEDERTSPSFQRPLRHEISSRQQPLEGLGEEDHHIVADAIIQAAQDTARNWDPQMRLLTPLPEQQEEVPTLGGRVQQRTERPIPGIAVDNNGRQYTSQLMQPPDTLEGIGAAATMNVPLAITGFSLGAYDAVATKFPELVDLLASGRYNTDDPEVISRAVDIAGIVTSGSFANRVAQEAGRSRQAARVARSEETGEPLHVPDTVTLNINSTRDGRFNIDATVDGDQAVDLYVRHLRTRPNDPNSVLQFGHAYIDEPWQRQGIASAVQQHLEAVTGKPFVPDNFLTDAAYQRWQKLDPDSVRGHVRNRSATVGDDPVYWQRSQMADIQDGRPWTETARMAEVRRAYAAGELRSPLGPNGEFTLRDAQQPRAPTLGTGGASDPPGIGHNRPPSGGRVQQPRPRNLDPAGYYSHAQESVGNLQPRGTPQQMWRSLEGQVRETEIRQLGLDEAVLGPAMARSRRFVVDQTADLSRLKNELKELGTGEGQDRWIHRKYPDTRTEDRISPAYREDARARQAELQRRVPAMEEQVRGHAQRHEERMQELSGTRASVSREDILARIEGNRPQIRETTYGAPRRPTQDEVNEAAAALAGPGRDWKPFVDELMANPKWIGDRVSAGSAALMIRGELEQGGRQLGTTLAALANANRSSAAAHAVRETIQKLTGRSVNDISLGSAPVGTRALNKFQAATLDPVNPTLRWRTMSTQGAESSAIEGLWQTIPEAQARVLRGTWEYVDGPHLARDGATPEQVHIFEQLRQEHAPLIDRIREQETRGNYVDPHFEEPNIFGHYASSLQRLADGETTLNLSQVQSGWFDKLRAGAKIPGHALVENMQAWLDPMLRRVIKDAVDQGASSITLPSADTVFRYNPPGEARAGITRLYDEIIPRRMRAMIRELDEGYTSRGDAVTKLQSLGDPMRDYPMTGPSGQSGAIRRIGGTMENVRDGFTGSWTKFDLTPAITRHHRQGRGMRLFSTGVPVEGEEDGPQD